MIKDFINTAAGRLQAGEQLVLAAVADSKGSTPQAAGAMMLAGSGGLICGTIGGGALEHHCLSEAAGLLKTGGRTGAGRSLLRSYSLDSRKAGSLGMICGGRTDVLFLLLSDPAPFQKAAALLAAGKKAWLCLPLDGSRPLWTEGESGGGQPLSVPPLPAGPSLIPFGEERGGSRPAAPSSPLRPDARGNVECARPAAAFLSVPLSSPGKVFLFGGGHVALELSALLKRLEFPYLVVDDRTEFSSRERFPGAVRTFVLPFSVPELAAAFAGPLFPCEADAFCIMTRGHEGDAGAVRFALSTPASYIGVMGSQQKREALFSRLEAEGYQDVRRRVKTPIGLPIGARTPAEIAVSVAAELIMWRAGKLTAKAPER